MDFETEPPKTTRLIKDFLKHGSLEPLTKKVLRIKTIASLLPNMLPPELAAHCRVVDLENGCLHLEVPDNQWATRLRYQQLELLSALRVHPQTAHIVTIKYRITPTNYRKSETTTSANPAPKSLWIPTSGKKLLANLAEKTTYEPLKEMLLRLAK